MNDNDFDMRKLLANLVENGVFLLGMVLMFFKTMDLAIAFAPATIGGYTGLEVWYGMGVALIVEGVVIAMKFSLSGDENPYEWVWGIAVLLIPFFISALAQVIDGFMVRQTLATQPENIQFLVNWGVPSIPTIVMFLLVMKAVFRSMPQSVRRKPGAGASVPTRIPANMPAAKDVPTVEPVNPTNGRQR